MLPAIRFTRLTLNGQRASGILLFGLFIPVMALSCQGCFLRKHRLKDEQVRTPVVHRLQITFSPRCEGLELSTPEERDGLRAIRFQCLSDRHTIPENDLIRGTFYSSAERSGHLPGVLVLPILKGGEPIAHSVGRAVAHAGMAAFVMKQKKTYFGYKEFDVKLTDAILRQALADARKVLSWMQARPEVDADRLGCAGVSMGGILASLLHAADGRIKASVWMLAGADLVDIIAESNEHGIRKKREKYFARHGFTVATFNQRFHGQLLDPAEEVGAINPRNVLMINAVFDRVVPHKNWQKLWVAAGRPERRLVPLGHYSSILILPQVGKWTAEFLKRKL